MRITTLVTAILSAVVLALTISFGAVFAADTFATLNGVKATPMASSELDAVKGLHVHFVNRNGGSPQGGPHLAGNPEVQGPGPDTVGNNWYLNGSPDGQLVAPSYHGLCVAAGTPSGIGIPSMGASQCP